MNLVLADAVLKHSLEMKWQLIGSVECDEARDRNQTAVARRETWTSPDVAEEHFVGSLIHSEYSL
jgi:hypothetical protein